MAKTIHTKKEIFIHPYKSKGFNFFGYFDNKYEAVIKTKLSDDLETQWYNGYVKLEEPMKEEYDNESFRNKNIVGVDTSDHCSKSENEQAGIIYQRLTRIIEQHYEKSHETPL